MAALPCCCGRAAAIFTGPTEPGVVTGIGLDIAAIGAAVTAIAVGSGSGVAGGAFGAAVGCGCGVRGSWVGATLGFGKGAVVGGMRIDTATTAAVGTLVGTVNGSGAGETAMTACVGTGLGASELSGAGVGFGGAVGANFESTCRTRGCGGADRGWASARVFG